MGRERERERESCIRKNGFRKNGLKERERACVYNKGLGEEIIKKIEKIDYLNKRGDKIDKLMWVFCTSGCVK